MSRVALKIGIAVGILAVSMTAFAAGPELGRAAPGFVGTDSYGRQVRLEDYRGKVVVLEWSNHDCPYVRKHYGTGNMQELQKFAVEQDVVWLTIISSAPGRQGHVGPGQANELTTSRDASPTAVVLDPEGDIGRKYQARTTPHMFVIDPQGQLMYKGGIDNKASANWATVDGARNYVREALTAVLRGESVEVSSARAYGCSVKY